MKTQTPFLIEADELHNAISSGDSRIKLVDASYAISVTGLTAVELYKQQRIHNAVFFDIDEVADPDAELPHTIPDAGVFEKAMTDLGIENDDHVVIYDQSGIAMAACRAFWMFRVFGHDNVSVLNGGMPAWLKAGYSLENGGDAVIDENAQSKPYNVTQPHPGWMCNMDNVRSSLDNDNVTIVDARAAARFHGDVAEPRPGLLSGHIPGSINIPFTEFLDARTGKIKETTELEAIFEENGIENTKIISSCGSGVTACVLALSASILGKDNNIRVYDGSWMEWGDEKHGNPIER